VRGGLVMRALKSGLAGYPKPIHFRFPRPCRFRSFSVSPRRRILLSGQLVPSEPFVNDLRHGQLEAVEVIHLVPVVVAICLLIQVTKQVEWLDGHIGSADAAL